jgi:hypothetical protein
MKTLAFFIIFAISVIFSSNSYADWTKVTETANGDTYYVDFKRIKKHDGYVYWWQLTNRLKPSSSGILSGKFYFQSDCKMFRYKTLSFSAHKKSMGEGVGKADNTPDKDWGYLPPNSSMETSLKAVCKFAS